MECPFLCPKDELQRGLEMAHPFLLMNFLSDCAIDEIDEKCVDHSLGMQDDMVQWVENFLVKLFQLFKANGNGCVINYAHG